MLKYEPEIHDMAQTICDKVLQVTGSGQVVNALDPFNCFTADAISQYCFGEPFGQLPFPLGCMHDANQTRLPREG